MGVFASQTTATQPFPMDPDQSATVRQLTGRELEAAQEAHRTSIATGSARAWAATFRRMLTKGASDPDVVQAIADPLTGFDRFSLVRAGLVSWSYPDPPTPAAIDDLTDEAVDFLALAILRLTKPALFADAEEARKNA